MILSFYYEITYQQLYQFIAEFTAYLNLMKNDLEYDYQQRMSYILRKMHLILAEEITKQ